jgi:signal transduction histidine kinase
VAARDGPVAEVEGAVVGMARATTATAVRGLLVVAGVAAVVLIVVQGGRLTGGAVPAAVRPFLAGAVAAVGLHLVLPRTLPRRGPRGAAGPYPALAEAARRMQSGTLEEVLPGLAQVVAEGTGAARAEVWLAVGDRLVAAARHPPVPGAGEEVPGLAALLTRPDTDHVVPVLDGSVLRAALAIAKPAAVTAADRQLMQDVANGAGLLLRVVALNAELADRVQRAADLAGELQASRGRLASARDLERRRLVAELAYATGGRLDTLRAEIGAAGAGLADPRPDPGRVRADLARARDHLDDLLDRFRAVARGVYPAVLRDHGPAAALDEVVADLPRGVRLTGSLGERLPWELESGLYYVAASAVRALAGQPADTPLAVRLERAGGRIGVAVEDSTPPVPPHRLATLLADDADRLAALGGGMDVTVPAQDADDPRLLVLHAWLPDRVEPVVVDATGPEVAVR